MVLYGGGGGGGAAVGQVCATNIPKNVGKISRLAQLQLRSFPLYPPNNKKRLKIVLKTYLIDWKLIDWLIDWLTLVASFL